MTEVGTVLPLEVEANALKDGAHSRCLKAGPDGACEHCNLIVALAVCAYYADADRVRARISGTDV